MTETQMAETGDDVALVLLRAMPPDAAEAVLGRLGGAEAARLRTRLKAAAAEPPAGDQVDAAIAQFFDLLRIVGRATPSAREYSPVATPPAEPPGSPRGGAIDELRDLPPDRLARALEGEQVGTIALALSCLDPTAAGQVIRRLPADTRAEILMRMAKPGARNQHLVQQLARAVAEKGRRLGDAPRELTPEELIRNLADTLRSLPRADRYSVVRKIETTDAELAAKVLEKLSRIEDLLKIPDRQLQILLTKLDVKTLAVALKGVDPAIRGKVTANMSSRSRTVLEEESELLGSIPETRVREAQLKMLELVRKGEEDGEIVMEE